MWEEVLKAVSVYLSAMIKFIFGPIGGKTAGLHLITTMVVTVSGMMTTVVAFTYFGEFIRKRIIARFKRNKPEQPNAVPKKNFFKRYGLAVFLSVMVWRV